MVSSTEDAGRHAGPFASPSGAVDRLTLALTRRAASAVAAATRAAGVSALRVRPADDAGAGSGAQAHRPEVVVVTEPAHGLAPGETAICRGAATVYVPRTLSGLFRRATVDLHGPRADRPPRLVVRESTIPCEEPG